MPVVALRLSVQGIAKARGLVPVSLVRVPSPLKRGSCGQQTGIDPEWPPVQASIAFVLDFGVKSQHEPVWIYAHQIQIKQRMKIGPKEQTVFRMVIVLAPEGINVSGLDDVHQLAP